MLIYFNIITLKIIAWGWLYIQEKKKIYIYIYLYMYVFVCMYNFYLNKWFKFFILLKEIIMIIKTYNKSILNIGPICSYSVHVSPIQSTLVHFVIFSPLWSSLFPFRALCSIWSICVHFDLFCSTSVHFCILSYWEKICLGLGWEYLF